MKYIILGTYIDNSINEEFGQICKYNDPAANNFQGWLIHGIKHVGDFSNIHEMVRECGFPGDLILNRSLETFKKFIGY